MEVRAAAASSRVGIEWSRRQERIGGRFTVWLAVAGEFFFGRGLGGDFLRRTGALSEERRGG